MVDVEAAVLALAASLTTLEVAAPGPMAERPVVDGQRAGASTGLTTAVAASVGP